MKKLSSLFAVLAVIVLFASCGAVGGAAATGAAGTPIATTSGQASGAALKGLYSQYKSDGKIDLQNMSNVMNIITLANGIQGLKGMDNKSAFYAEFATGLVLGSQNLITNDNSSAITGLLGGLASQNLSALTSKANSAISDAASTAQGKIAGLSEKTEAVASTLSTLNSIFGMLK